MTFSFNVYGYRFSIQGNVEEAVKGLQQDFSFFSAPPCGDEGLIELIGEDSPLHDVPTGDASVCTPRNAVYRQGNTRYIDYHGRGLGIHQEGTGNLKMYSRDPDLLYEAAYLFLLSKIGQALDERGIHRIHALGVEVRGRVLLVLLPMGGGKSTLGLHLLKSPEVRILSDDCPWIDRTGRVLACPLRIGLMPGSEQTVPPEHRRVIQRMEFGPKHVVSSEYFRDRVCPSGDPGIVFLGSRILLPECHIEEVGRAAALQPMLANCVIGVGLFQGLEYILDSSALELVKKTGLGLSRMRNCWQLLRRASICRVHLGRDPECNAKTILEYALKVAK
jgi:hypothetical protein